MAHVNTVVTTVTHASRVPTPAARAPRRGAILVVEDRDDVRQGMAKLLELRGFLVVDASGGEQALTHLRTDPRGFALILLDLMMPGPITGSDFRRLQLTIADLAEVPTIVVSASDPDATLRSELRPEAWVSKPFRFDDLLVLVKQFVTPEAGALIVD